MDVLIFIIALSVLVLVHEFGHYIAAKLNGVRVDEFGLGLPPRIVGKNKWGTLWSLNWLPIGGFCKMYGEDPSEKGAGTAKDSFLTKKPTQKAIIVVGGVLMNLVLAVVIFAVSYTISGIPVESGRVKILEVAKDSPAEKAGLREGEIILKIGDKDLTKGEDLTQEVGKNKGEMVEIIVGNGRDRSVQNPEDAARSVQSSEDAIRSVQNPEDAARSVQKNLDDAARSVQSSEDAIRSVQNPDDAARSVQKNLDDAARSVQSSEDAIRSVQNPEDAARSVQNLDDTIRSVQVQIREVAPEGQGLMGVVVSSMEVKKIEWYQFYKGIGAGFKEAYFWGETIAKGVWSMVTGLFVGQIPKDVTGPIGMFKATEQIRSQEGLLAVIHFFGIISVNLAIVNILPLPALDGGRILFVIYELLTGKRANEKFETIVNSIGMMILLGLILLITVGDVKNLMLKK